jgi:hypothetical protein
MKAITMSVCYFRRAARFFSIAGLAIGGLSLFVAAAQACPMCSQSIAEENLLPHAYMYSIIFMLTMPAAVFAGIGSFIFFQFRKAAALPSSDAADDVAPTSESGEPEHAAQA